VIGYLLDTNVISQLARTAPTSEANAVSERIHAHGNECCVSTLTIHELAYGIERLPAGSRREALTYWMDELILPRFPVVHYDTVAARWHARERARLRAAGREVPLIDGQIAAIAATNGLVLVTGNTRHFAHFRGLVVEDWLEER